MQPLAKCTLRLSAQFPARNYCYSSKIADITKTTLIEENVTNLIGKRNASRITVFSQALHKNVELDSDINSNKGTVQYSTDINTSTDSRKIAELEYMKH